MSAVLSMLSSHPRCIACHHHHGVGTGHRPRFARASVPTCGAWMPKYGELCARRPGHRWEHRSEYALENARAFHGVTA